MLIEFYGKNFGCFRDEFRLSMVAAKIDAGDDRGIVEVKVDGQEEPLRLLRAAAIYGANASGKSTILAAVDSLRRLIAGYRRRELVTLADSLLENSYTPFAGSKDPVELGLVANLGGKIYDYRITFGPELVKGERLSLVETGPKEVLLFNREKKGATGKWSDDPRFRLISEDQRPNVPLLNVASFVAPGLAGEIADGLSLFLGAAFYPAHFPPYISRHRSRPMRFSDPAKRVHDDPKFRTWLTDRLASADVGIAEVKSQKIEEELDFGPSISDRTTSKNTLARGGGTGKIVRYELKMGHRAGEGNFELPLYRESTGTVAFIRLAPFIYDLTHSEGFCAAFVDEIHESLHPTLLQALIRDFNCNTSMNYVRGQLIFTTHETMLLDAEAKNNILRRDQIYFTKKLEDGSSQLYSLVEFKERNNLNLRKRYLEGRYGALPAVDGGEEMAVPEAGGK